MDTPPHEASDLAPSRAQHSSGGLLVSVEVATSLASLLQTASAVLAESADEGRLGPYDQTWLVGLIGNLETFGSSIIGLADATSLVDALPGLPRAD